MRSSRMLLSCLRVLAPAAPRPRGGAGISSERSSSNKSGIYALQPHAASLFARPRACGAAVARRGGNFLGAKFEQQIRHLCAPAACCFLVCASSRLRRRGRAAGQEFPRSEVRATDQAFMRSSRMLLPCLRVLAPAAPRSRGGAGISSERSSSNRSGMVTCSQEPLARSAHSGAPVTRHPETRRLR